MAIKDASWFDWLYFDEEEGEWLLKEETPQAVKQEYEEHKKAMLLIPDENGIVTQY